MDGSWVDEEFKKLQEKDAPLRDMCDMCQAYIQKLVQDLMEKERLTIPETHVVASFIINEQARNDIIGKLAYSLMEEYLDSWWVDQFGE